VESPWSPNLSFLVHGPDLVSLTLEESGEDMTGQNVQDGGWEYPAEGSQQGLLLHPDIFRKIFKPMYREYVEIARSHGKHVFMHSDGYILDIIPDLIEVGIDALNAQVFCMGLKELGDRFRGRITFWGEIDRQRLEPVRPLQPPEVLHVQVGDPDEIVTPHSEVGGDGTPYPSCSEDGNLHRITCVYIDGRL
jgi:hypothetical protein